MSDKNNSVGFDISVATASTKEPVRSLVVKRSIGIWAMPTAVANACFRQLQPELPQENAIPRTMPHAAR